MRNLLSCVTVLALCAAPETLSAQNVIGQMSDEEVAKFIQENAGKSAEEMQGELRTLNDKQLNAQRASSGVGYSYSSPPTLNFRTVAFDTTVTQSGPIPLVIGTGVISAVSFVSDDLASWQIKNVLYDRQLFSINGSPCGDGGRNGKASEAFAGNVINISPCQFWISGGTINVSLDGVSQPIMLAVTAGSDARQPEVDAQLTVQVSDRGKNPWGQLQSRRIAVNPIAPVSGALPEIFPASGVITDISFVDRDGYAWPIEEIVYAPRDVSIGGSECGAGTGRVAGTGNVAYVTLCRSRRSNIAVKLQGAPAAIGMMIVPPGAPGAPGAPDSSMTVQVVGRSPAAIAAEKERAAAEAAARSAAAEARTREAEAQATLEATRAQVQAAAASAALKTAGTPSAGLPNTNADETGFQPDRYLADFVNGTVPRGARSVALSGATNLEGYVYDNKLYVRGPYRPVNPAADASASSSNGGVNVWRYNRPVVGMLVSDTRTGMEYTVTADF